MTAVTRRVPEAMEDESGELWWVEGHIEPALMVLAVVREQMVNVGPQEAFDLLTGGKTNYRPDQPRRTYDDQERDRYRYLFGQVRHIWLVQDEKDEEMQHRCGADTPGAEPFTVLDLNIEPEPDDARSAGQADV